MVDPVTLSTLAIGALAGAGTAAAASGGSAAGGNVSVEAPKPISPGQDVSGTKPVKKSTQPSFLAGASMLPAAAPSGVAGKSLLGQ